MFRSNRLSVQKLVSTMWSFFRQNVYHSQIVPMFSIDSVCLPLHEGVCLLLFVAEVQAYAACSHETYSSLSVCFRSASAGVYHSQTVPIVQRKVLVLRLHINLTG